MNKISGPAVNAGYFQYSDANNFELFAFKYNLYFINKK